MTSSLPKTKSKRNLQIMLEPYFYLAPGMLLILLVTLVPLLIGISYSFQHMVVYDTFNTGFVGLENYRLILGDALFWNALWNTLRWTVVSLVFQVSLGLGLASVLGHIFPVFADFKGGKGVATLLGMVIAIQPIVAVCCVGVFILVLFLTRFVSLSSILASVAFAVFILFIWNEKEPLYRVFAVAVALMVVFTHQKNINRLLKGTESKVHILRNKEKRKNK